MRVDEGKIEELNALAKDGVTVLAPGELSDWIDDMAASLNFSKASFMDDCLELTDGLVWCTEKGYQIDDTQPVIIDDTNLNGIYDLYILGKNLDLKELFTDSIKAYDLIVDVELHTVSVDNVDLGADWHWTDGELLWQAISESSSSTFSPSITLHVTEDNVGEWQDLPDDNIEVLLSEAKRQGFIDSYELD